jgi:NAD+ kinase
MNPAIQTCAVVGKFDDPSVAETAAALLPYLADRGLTVLVLDDAAIDRLGPGITPVSAAELERRAQLAVVIGGDGSLLYAARLVANGEVPLLGINRGRLGFLTDVMPQDMLNCVNAALEGRCSIDHRPLLVATLTSPTGELAHQFALNDVVLQKWETGRILDFETQIDGRYVNTHGGDGLVVASATGSTAYALSCGGPIVQPDLDVLVVVPICPHTLSDRPIVVSRSSHVSVRLLERADVRAQVTCDGIVLGEMHPGDLLEIAPSQRRITLLHPPGYNYYRLLRSKLHWGRGSFEHER